MRLKFVAFLVIFATLPPCARAEFTVCNQTLDVANVAIATTTNNTTRSEGWWPVAANRCVVVVKGPLVNRYLYLLALDIRGRPLIGGSVKMCMASRKFVIEDAASCWRRGYEEGLFTEIDTGSAMSWTVFLKSP